MGRRGLSHVLLDTHVWAWSLTDKKRLSTKATDAIAAAQTIWISAISLYEIGQKVHLGKWLEMEPHFLNLMEIAEEQGASILSVSPMTCLAAADIRWSHRDPFDRIIAAAAIVERVPLISADNAFDDFSSLDL